MVEVNDATNGVNGSSEHSSHHAGISEHAGEGQKAKGWGDGNGRGPTPLSEDSDDVVGCFDRL